MSKKRRLCMTFVDDSNCVFKDDSCRLRGDGMHHEQYMTDAYFL